jgi:hypothetical protein
MPTVMSFRPEELQGDLVIGGRVSINGTPLGIVQHIAEGRTDVIILDEPMAVAPAWQGARELPEGTRAVAPNGLGYVRRNGMWEAVPARPAPVPQDFPNIWDHLDEED